MSNLRSTIQTLAARFAESVIEALRSASLDEITGVTSGATRGRPRAAGGGEAAPSRGRRAGGGRLARRSADDIQAMVQSIVDLVGKHPDGLRAEQIRASLGVDAKELPRPLAEAVSAGVLTKSGQKRATTYSSGSGGGGGGRTAKRKSRRAKRG